MQLTIWLRDLFADVPDRGRELLKHHRHHPSRRRGGRQWTTESLEQRALLASDFGDAPDIGTGTAQGDYQTLSSDNGPEHALDVTQLTLFLGNSVDADGGTLQNAMASGDDVFTMGGLDDEDGVLSPLDLQGTEGTSPTVTLLATNDTGSAATLSGWIDYDADGVFDNATERAQISVPSGSTDVRFTLTFPAIPEGSAGATYARFRLSTDAAAANSTGLATDGEVEDYVFTITARSSGTVNSYQKISDGLGGLAPDTLEFSDFGSAVSTIGDLDGDGVPDLAVGASYDGLDLFSDEGAVYVLLLNADGTVRSQQKISDGIGGLAPNTLESHDHFGSAVSGMGDLDGDGVPDLAVGASGDENGDSEEGAIYVLFLNADGTVKSQRKISDGLGGLAPDTLDSFDRFGNAVSCVGDLDGDGVPDLAVGALSDENVDSAEGAVYVLLLNVDGTVKSQQKISDGLGGLALNTLDFSDFFGSAVSSIGDLDGDGVSDLAVGAMRDDNGDSNAGAVYVLLLNADGTVKSQQKISDGQGGLAINTLESNVLFGNAVSSVPDLDGDGVGELAVGARGAFGQDIPGGGAVYLLWLNANGTVKRQQKISDGHGGFSDYTLRTSDRFGSAVSSLGDLDGDGVPEIAIGASWVEGAVYILSLASAFDFGDAPDTGSGNGPGNFNTLSTDDGPRHWIVDTNDTLFLGGSVDGDRGDLHNAAANADDVDDFDDEDGVLRPFIDLLGTIGAQPTITLQATNMTGRPATLFGWIDYNADGIFDNATERSQLEVPDNTTRGQFTLTFPTIPDGSADATYARFRLSTDAAAANATGVSSDGEVEDYVFSLVSALERDYGDAPDTGSGNGSGNFSTMATDNGPSHRTVMNQDTLFLGASVDADDGTLQNSAANADDVGGWDDEDGVLSPFTDLSGTIGAQPTVTLLATNTTGRAAILSGWIDYDNDGVFENATERAQIVVPDATTNVRFKLMFPSIPKGAAGPTYARFRLSTDTAATDATGAAQDGEVEDYVFTITAQSSGRVDRSLKIAHELNGGPTLANHDYLGFSVASVGDLDGDGVADLAVGTRGDDTGGSNHGAVHVLLLNTNGTVKRSTKIAHQLNGGPTLAKFDGFGGALAGVGDLDGDGVPDLAVGASGDTGASAVYMLLLNSDGTAKRTVRIGNKRNGGPTLSVSDGFGTSVTFLGDLDGDGVGDLAVGAIGDSTGGHSYGATHVLFLKPDGTVKSSRKIAHQTNGGPTLGSNFQFGRSVAGLGDLDGDGVSDLAVGVPQDSTGGQRHGVIYMLLLNADGTVKSSTRIGHETNGGPTLSMFARFGTSMASVGDLDGDGVTDLAVGAREIMHVLFMNRDGTAKRSTIIGSDICGGPTLPDFSEFGNSVANMGDLNGDGVTDLVVGALRDDTGGRSRGAVWVLNLAGPPGVTVTQTAGISTVVESGSTDTIGVVLDARPELDVVIDVTSADIGEVTVSTPFLIFTPTNWDTVQSVTLTGVDDNTVDGDRSTLVTLSIADSSSDALYESLPHQTVTVTTTDNDVLPQDPGNVDGDQDFDANDSFLIHLVKLSGTDAQINQSKGSSPLGAAEIRAAIAQLNTVGDVDGDQDFDANDSFLIHLVKLSGTDAQIDQSKGSSALSATQIRANVNDLGLAGRTLGTAGEFQVQPFVLAAEPDRDLFGTDNDEQPLVTVAPKSLKSVDSLFRNDFRTWIDVL